MNPKDRLIVALDFDSEEKAVSMAERLKNDVRFFKVGFELFTACGPKIVQRIKEMDCEVFLDLKFHDIPNTVARAAAQASRMGVYMYNVHALGGYDMMKAAAEASHLEAERLGLSCPKVVALTMLTSMDKNALKKIGINVSMEAEVLRLAQITKSAGLDGVVASPQEAALIRRKLGQDFLIVTPGVRPSFAARGDQKRVARPKAAIEAGADFIVVGRPIIEAKDPLSAAQAILDQMRS